jgi:hypothetical protein
MKDRKKLSDILRNGDRSTLQQAWAESKAAGEFAPLPAGEYAARLVSGEVFTAKAKGTLGYKLAFEIAEGGYQGRRCWHDLWLTPAAMPMTKRDLAKLGVTELAQLDRPLPAVFLCRVRLVMRTADDGTQYNAVRLFEVTGIEPEEFAPTEGGPQP